eukprot:m.11326 g.11326  ORF g.11326 m.11326 type:complete len:71 (+) comp4423_c0_seq1:5896-6108(+)
MAIGFYPVRLDAAQGFGAFFSRNRTVMVRCLTISEKPTGVIVPARCSRALTLCPFYRGFSGAQRSTSDEK